MELVILLIIGVVIALAGMAWLHGHKAGVESAIARATTIPSGVAKKIDAVVPGSSGAAQSAASAAGSAVQAQVDRVS